MMHDLEIPQYKKPKECICCGAILNKRNLDNNMALCTRCSNEAMAENQTFILAKYGVEVMKHIQNKHYQAQR